MLSYSGLEIFISRIGRRNCCPVGNGAVFMFFPHWNWAEKLISREEEFCLRERPEWQSSHSGGFDVAGSGIGAVPPNPPQETRAGVIPASFQSPMVFLETETPWKNPFVEIHLHKKAPELESFLFLACIYLQEKCPCHSWEQNLAHLIPSKDLGSNG